MALERAAGSTANVTADCGEQLGQYGTGVMLRRAACHGVENAVRVFDVAIGHGANALGFLRLCSARKRTRSRAEAGHHRFLLGSAASPAWRSLRAEYSADWPKGPKHYWIAVT